MAVIVIPEPGQLRKKRVVMTVSTGKGDAMVSSSFEVDLPQDVGTAVAMFGEPKVLRDFIGYYAIEVQGIERLKLQKRTREEQGPGSGGRKRGRYLDDIGL